MRPNLTGAADPLVVRTVSKLSDRIDQAFNLIKTAREEAAQVTPPDFQVIRSALTAGGKAPLNVNNLVGVLSQPQLPGGPVKLVSLDYQMQTNDFTILVDSTAGAVAVTLPDASTCTQHIYNIKRVDTGGGGVSIISTDNIDGISPQTLAAQYDSIAVQSDGTTFWIIGRA